VTAATQRPALVPRDRDAPARRRAGRLPADRRSRATYAILFGLTLLVLLVLAPFFVIVINAFKDPADLAAHGPLTLPHGWHFSAIKNFWTQVHFGGVLLNSLEISGIVAVLGVVLSLLNAYALGIGRLRGRVAFLIFFLIANVLPQEGLVYPLYYLAKQVHLYDTKLVIVIIFTVIQSTFGTYLLASVFAAFPLELLEAAAIDGANKWRALWNVVVPISRPTLGVLFTFFFIWTWNEFFLPLVFLIDNSKQTVPVALAVSTGQHTVNVTSTAASSLLGVLPAIVFFLIFQRTLTRGVAVGAVK
jgi:raffinose/stachyose/melibiose transport system permease protein